MPQIELELEDHEWVKIMQLSVERDERIRETICYLIERYIEASPASHKAVCHACGEPAVSWHEGMPYCELDAPKEKKP